LVETKASYSDVDSNSDLEPDSNLEPNKVKQIIDVEPSVTITTTKVVPKELDEPKEREHLFHSHMWVKGTPLNFIVDKGS
jgi:hypothetical protein